MLGAKVSTKFCGNFGNIWSFNQSGCQFLCTSIAFLGEETIYKSV